MNRYKLENTLLSVNGKKVIDSLESLEVAKLLMRQLNLLPDNQLKTTPVREVKIKETAYYH